MFFNKRCTFCQSSASVGVPFFMFKKFCVKFQHECIFQRIFFRLSNLPMAPHAMLISGFEDQQMIGGFHFPVWTPILRLPVLYLRIKNPVVISMFG
jgi:hypothetical protein